MEETSGGYFLAYLRGTAKIVVKIPRPAAGGIFTSSFRCGKTGVGIGEIFQMPADVVGTGGAKTPRIFR